MALEDSVNTLVTNTTALLDAVNVSKATLDNSVDAAHISATNSEASAQSAATSATNAQADRILAQDAATAAQTAESNAVAVVTGGTASLTAEAGKLPIADANGYIDHAWLNKDTLGLQYTPSVQPTLSSDFTSNEHKRYEQYGPEPKTILQQWSVARNSEATYFDANGVLQTAGINEPRVDYDPATGECRGLLVEGQRTNLLPYSEEFDNAEWMRVNITVTAAPEGFYVVNDTATDSVHTLGDIVFPEEPLERVIWFVVRNVTGAPYIYIDISDGGGGGHAFFDTTSFELVPNGDATPQQYVDAGSIRLHDGWVLVYATYPASTNTSINVRRAALGFSQGATYSSKFYAGGSYSMELLRAQAEYGQKPTSYIPTTSAAVTRVADQITPTV